MVRSIGNPIRFIGGQHHGRAEIDRDLGMLLRELLRETVHAEDREVRLAPCVLAAARAGEFGLAVGSTLGSRPMRGLQIELPAGCGERGESFRERSVGDDVVRNPLTGFLAADGTGA